MPDPRFLVAAVVAVFAAAGVFAYATVAWLVGVAEVDEADGWAGAPW